jgi:hypothetical protein
MRLQQPHLLRDGGRGRQVQRAALAAQPAEVGRVVGSPRTPVICACLVLR